MDSFSVKKPEKNISSSCWPDSLKIASGGRNWFFWGMSILPPDHGVLGILVSELYEFIIKITLTGSQIVHIYKIQHFTFKNRAFKLYTNIRELENYFEKNNNNQTFSALSKMLMVPINSAY